MITYDSWKLDNPYDDEDNNCAYCDAPCENTYCSKECRIEDNN